jgi:hypothetical protein
MSAGIVGWLKSNPLTPALSLRERRKGSRFVCFSKFEFSQIVHVGVNRPSTAISPSGRRKREPICVLFKT